MIPAMLAQTFSIRQKADYEEIPELKEKGPKHQLFSDPIINQLLLLDELKDFKTITAVITKALEDEKNPLPLIRAAVMLDSIDKSKKELSRSYFNFFSEDPLIAKLTALKEKISVILNPTKTIIRSDRPLSYGSTGS